MGCWDIYCFICGNSCHSLSEDFYDEYLDDDSSNKSIGNKIKDLYDKTLWLESCTLLLENNQVIHGAEEGSCSIDFFKDGKYYENIFQYSDFANKKLKCIFLHDDCYQYIKTKYGIELTFGHLPPYNLKSSNLFNIKYGEIEKYQEQDYDFPQIIKDRKQYLCLSPLLNGKNITQINKNIRALNLKNDPKRKGPAVSATFYKTGDIKLGLNGMFWIISKGKWMEIKEKPKKIKIKLNNDTSKIKKIPYVGHHNTKPIFLLSLDILKNKKITGAEILLLESAKFKI
jgi:hypothetical protein